MPVQYQRPDAPRVPLAGLAPASVAAAVLVALVMTGALLFQPNPRRNTTPSWTSYAGGNYVWPNTTIDGCSTTAIDWLQQSCWNSTSQSAYATSSKQLFTSDMAYVKSNNLGNVQHVWIGLDSLFAGADGVDVTTAYTGLDSQSLANFDDMISILHDDGMQAIVSMYVVDTQTKSGYFNLAALTTDDTLKQGYLQAASDFLTHIKGNTVDSETIQLVDLLTEPYFQEEQYLCGGTCGNPPVPDLPLLGPFSATEPAYSNNSPTSTYYACLQPGNTTCGPASGYGVVNSAGHDDAAMIDVNIVYPFLNDLYKTAVLADPGLDYTFSDTGRLLNSSTSYYSSQAFWKGLYPVDVRDIHFYETGPMTPTVGTAAADPITNTENLGETPIVMDAVGCDTGSPCTYNPAQNYAPLQWDFAHANSYGVHLLLSDQSDTNLWTYSTNTTVTPHTYSYTATADTPLVQTYEAPR